MKPLMWLVLVGVLLSGCVEGSPENESVDQVPYAPSDEDLNHNEIYTARAAPAKPILFNETVRPGVLEFMLVQREDCEFVSSVDHFTSHIYDRYGLIKEIYHPLSYEPGTHLLEYSFEGSPPFIFAGGFPPCTSSPNTKAINLTGGKPVTLADAGYGTWHQNKSFEMVAPV